MPKVAKQKAGKDYPGENIKKGDIYYSWSFYRGPTMRSKKYPRPSQLTGSETLSNAYGCVEALEDAVADAKCPSDLVTALEDCKGNCDDVISGFEEKIGNLEEAFPNGCPALEEAEEQKSNFESFQEDVDSALDDVQANEGDTPFDELSADDQEALMDSLRSIANTPEYAS